MVVLAVAVVVESMVVRVESVAKKFMVGSCAGSFFWFLFVLVVRGCRCGAAGFRRGARECVQLKGRQERPCE